ncbi:hypothetical protein RHGRI_000310 [Rhododendron griersonianum]|uniref:Uncharacterized protein n=1 Tax=Rhododendron griersonianum TaxID=479676 RepID=A0AAV6LG50_9ERIC|nr:hypothetical protein RHGRI_000310 [Rhododendron griersonianum]
MLLRRALNNLQKEGLAKALASKVLGFVISDWLTTPRHSNYTKSIQAAILAGIDMVIVILDSLLFKLFCFSLYPSSDGSGGRKHPSEKENGVNQVLDKGVGLSSLPISQESSTSKSRG